MLIPSDSPSQNSKTTSWEFRPRVVCLVLWTTLVVSENLLFDVFGPTHSLRQLRPVSTTPAPTRSRDQASVMLLDVSWHGVEVEHAKEFT